MSMQVDGRESEIGQQLFLDGLGTFGILTVRRFGQKAGRSGTECRRVEREHQQTAKTGQARTRVCDGLERLGDPTLPIPGSLSRRPACRCGF